MNQGAIHLDQHSGHHYHLGHHSKIASAATFAVGDIFRFGWFFLCLLFGFLSFNFLFFFLFQRTLVNLFLIHRHLAARTFLLPRFASAFAASKFCCTSRYIHTYIFIRALRVFFFHFIGYHFGYPLI